MCGAGRRAVTCVVWIALLINVCGGGATVMADEWPNQCGDGRVGRVLNEFEDPSDWQFCCSDRDLPSIQLVSAEGCSGRALAIEYDLNGGDWFVLTRDFSPALDLAGVTHLRIALRGSDLAARHNLQIKLVDREGVVHWVVAESVTDLPVWRPMYVDLRELTCFGDPETCAESGDLDRSAIVQIQIAIARCLRNGEPCEPSTDQAALFLDEFAAVDLRPGGQHRLEQRDVERVQPAPDLRASTANAILIHQHSNGLVPAWFPETEPNYNTYAQACALLVFVGEYGRTHDTLYRDAAERLVTALRVLQIADDRRSHGGWFTGYRRDGEDIVAADASCTGDEERTQDIDRCSWIGNTAWAVIALADYYRIVDPNSEEVMDATVRATDWMLRQRGRIEAYPDLVTEGLEGNLSTWFGLVAGGHSAEANRLGDAIYEHGWDPVEQRMKIGARKNDFATAMDTSGSWGAQFLRRTGHGADALRSQGYAATVLRTRSFGDTNAVEGYGDIAGPWTPTVEFGAQGAAAGILDANRVMQEIYRLQAPDGSFPGSPDDWYGGTVAPWTTTMTGVAPTAWVYFAQNGDPLLRGVRRRPVRRPAAEPPQLVQPTTAIEPVRPPPPSESSSVGVVDNVLHGLDWGSIAFNAPSKMRYKQPQRVELLLSPSQPISQLQRALDARTAVESARVRIANRMEASLTGTGFLIQALAPSLQAITSEQPTRWKWEVTPTESGTRRLALALSAHIDVAGREAPLVVRTFERTIEVQISVGQRLSAFVHGNWQWLWGAILVPIAGYLWSRRKKRSDDPTRHAAG